MRARPTVAYRTPLPPDAVIEAFREALALDDGPCSGHLGRSEVTLFVHDRHRRIWSPFLQLRVEPDAGGTRVRGVMGPQPSLWTVFVFVYAVEVMGVLAGSIFGSVQLMLGQTPTGWAWMGLALLGLVGACSLDLLGRRLGHGQMGVLRGMVERTLPGAVELG